MNGGLLLVTLLCSALGISLAAAPAKMLVPSITLIIASAVPAAQLVAMPARQAMIGCAFSILVTALSVYLRRVPAVLVLLLALNAGFWCGALAAFSAEPSPLLALPLVLSVYPARWVLERHQGVVLKILAGWLVAISILTVSLPLITTAGYEPDHKD